MNKNLTFFFYDYESFGVGPALDRPAQFAGIRTDSDFNIIGEPVMFYCKQTPDYLPSPEAVMVTGITPQQCNAEGVPEPEFAARIHAEFSQPNTCILGYNNIRYDDEMTRYTFFRNFFDPYEYSWKNGNSRWDLLDLVRACYALRPDGIEWVIDENGVPNFKLENLTKANGIAHENAHDAMADVYATIAMAKLIKQKQPKLFQFFFENRGKKEIEKMIDTGEMTPLVHVSGMFGNARANTAWIAPIAWHPTNQNQVLCCDLSGDVSALLTDSAEELRTRLYTKKEELAEGVAPVPLKGVHINRCPIIAPAKVLLPENAARLGIDRERCLENLKLLKANKSLVREKVTEIFMEERSFEPSANVETTLYDGFFSPADKNNMSILRTLPPQELAHHGLQFADERVEALLFHYRARHYPETLSRAEQIKWQKYCHQQIDAKSAQFAEAIDSLFQIHHDNPEKVKLLENLTAYAAQIAEFQVVKHTANEQNEQLVSALNQVAEQRVNKAAKLEMLKTLIK
ncbi:exodeoxyribonuclease I [Actinobacillus pleuropneumoniae]|uniref:Exodeoxyribonuclease I n=2 Tax=Actinobacillus pleuropneumoniae TaxID=715 RepID=A0ABM6X1N4_ACTPL|nr:exodeoxyribonuclease I [Actinobacillus pleuropneumoniae]AWG95083.1 exodeoxyribonuclease I [Actinobacillus pleuropneumoniae serovar 1 str. 4074]AXA21155.1 exodeoxyribonuclease I [Actinobacillus pleuropneumoniae]EFM94490.1 Exonuclease I [Actinobacillus pleuropneumoniae serovar 9 str. CVJ13261]EFM98821.1 Exonuclease I [Actinobacillus pleuropneumoniae serovar 11 str. 56153]MBL4535578.1 exodeoxyribonuclease I [Actinobacillus pleuropneumoniae]